MCATKKREPSPAINKRELAYTIYDSYRTARLGVLYYEESLKHWTTIVLWHDILIAVAGGTSPIAFWQHSDKPLLKQAWFYLTLVAAVLSLLKPILKWERKVALYSKLNTRYCDIYMDLKYLIQDMTTEQDLTKKTNSQFKTIRKRFKSLGKDEPPHDTAKIERLQERVKEEIDIRQCWLPPKGDTDVPADTSAAPRTEPSTTGSTTTEPLQPSSGFPD